MVDASRGAPPHLYHDDPGMEMTPIDHDHEDHDEDEEGQLMLRQGSKTELSAGGSRCRKCPFVLLFLILLIAGTVGYVNKNDVDISVVGKLVHDFTGQTTETEDDKTLGVTEMGTYEPTYYPSNEPPKSSHSSSTSEPTYYPSYVPTRDQSDQTRQPATSSPIASTSEPTYYPSYVPTKNPSYAPTPTENVLEPAASSNDTALLLTKHRQIANYISGEALILNIHITHHAGTSVCAKMSDCGPTPSFACMKHKKNDGTPWPDNDPQLNRNGLTYDDAQLMVHVFRPYFHFMSMEYPRWGNLHHMNWEYENLVSMIVMRDPLDRFLAGGKCGGYHNTIINEADPDPENEEVQRLYWDYANDSCADNYALRVLAKDKGCNAKNMNECYETAKSLLQRFTFILDEECLDESMEAMGDQLGLQITSEGFESRHHHYHKTARERINNETLYEFLLDKFYYDIELYEWSKSLSVVTCSELIDNVTMPTYSPTT